MEPQNTDPGELRRLAIRTLVQLAQSKDERVRLQAALRLVDLSGAPGSSAAASPADVSPGALAQLSKTLDLLEERMKALGLHTGPKGELRRRPGRPRKSPDDRPH